MARTVMAIASSSQPVVRKHAVARGSLVLGCFLRIAVTIQRITISCLADVIAATSRTGHAVTDTATNTAMRERDLEVRMPWYTASRWE